MVIDETGTIVPAVAASRDADPAPVALAYSAANGCMGATVDAGADRITVTAGSARAVARIAAPVALIV